MRQPGILPGFVPQNAVSDPGTGDAGGPAGTARLLRYGRDGGKEQVAGPVDVAGQQGEHEAQGDSDDTRIYVLHVTCSDRSQNKVEGTVNVTVARPRIR